MSDRVGSCRVRVLAAVLPLAIGLVALSAVAPAAEAGTYRAIGCEVEAGAFTPETASFHAVGYPWDGSGCSDSGDPWLFVGAGPGIWNASPGSYGEWTISVPPGLRLREGWFQAFPALTPGMRAEYRYRLEGAADSTAPSPVTTAGWYNWPAEDAGEAFVDEVALRVICLEGGKSCFYDSAKGGPPPGINVRSPGFEVDDYARPSVGVLGGALMEGAAQRGIQVLSVPASDQGSGVARVTVGVSGTRYASDDPGCALASDGSALRLAPCPISPTVQLPVDTTNALFSEGKNPIEICVMDYAQEGDDPTSFAGEVCVSASVYVDNSCDVSQARDAADIRFGFGKRGREHITIRYGKRAQTTAKLTDAADEPIEDATVCVSAKDRVTGAGEVDVAEVQTNRRGRAKVRLPKGASRRVKLTYWRDSENVEIETVRLNVRARPTLKVLSERKLSEGGKARFRVKLAGPYRKRRKVAVQALAPAGWLDFPGCVGKTNKKGAFRCSYRFREQSGSVKYKFRALVPRQSGYPYLQGRTGSKKLVVRD